MRETNTEIKKKSGPKEFLRKGKSNETYVDYKDSESLRKLLTPNGKIHSRKRLGTSAQEQRLVNKAIKRARFVGLLPYTNGTL